MMFQLTELFGEANPMKRRHLVKGFCQRLKVRVLLDEPDTCVGRLQTPEIVLKVVVSICSDDGDLVFGNLFVDATSEE